MPFNETIKQLTTQTRNHASNFNEVNNQLLENTIYNKEHHELLKEQVKALEGASQTPEWDEVTGKPTTFPPSTHVHAIADVSGLQTVLDEKVGATHNHTGTQIHDLNGDAKFRYVGSSGIAYIQAGNSINNGDMVLGGYNGVNLTSFNIMVNDHNAKVNNHKIYHQGYKPTATDIGASPSNHNHDNLYASKQGVYSGIISGGMKASDTRNVQYTPEWYITNKPMTTVTEFKTTAAVGITGTNSMHCYLETHTPWNDSSGGYPMQIAWLDTRTPLYRWGINATTWGEWQSLGEGGGDVAGKTYVKATRTVENTGNPNSNLTVINYTNSKGGVCKIAQFGSAKMQIIVDGVMVLDGTGTNSYYSNHEFLMGDALSESYGELPTYPFKNNVKVVDRSSNSGTRVYTAHFYVNA